MIIKKIKQVAIEDPDRIAICDEKQKISYQILDQKSDLVAKFICSLPIKHKTIILICTRSTSTMIAILGILKAGCRYVPIEWSKNYFDVETIVNCVDNDAVIFANDLYTNQDIGIKSILISDISDLKDHNFKDKLLVPRNEDIYINFTSGTTGKPKGVVIKYESVDHYLSALKERIDLPDGLVYAYLSNFSTDLGNTTLFLSLATGGELHILGDLTRKDPNLFWNYIINNKINFLKTTPSHFQALLCGINKFEICLKYLLLGGEKFEIKFASKLLKIGIAKNIYNHYGPTETTIGVSVFRIDEDLINRFSDAVTVPVGKIWKNLKYKLVNKTENKGELYLAGCQVARGYYSDSEQTAHYFLQEGHDIFYKTGDIVREYEEGILEFIGRADRQLKVRGFRIAPEQIEIESSRHPFVQRSVVFIVDNNGKDRLILAVILLKDKKNSKKYILGYLKKKLPKYMLPDDVYIIDFLPIKSSGKLDTDKLIQQYKYEKNTTFASKGGDSPLQENKYCIIQNEWSNFFGTTNEGDNFFSLGANSIDAIEFISKLQTQNLNITAKQFLDNPTLGGLRKAVNNIETLKMYNYKGRFQIFHPVQQWYFENCTSFDKWFNQSMVISTSIQIDYDIFRKTIKLILEAHPALRTKYTESDGSFEGIIVNNINLYNSIHFYKIIEENSLVNEEIAKISRKYNRKIDQDKGDLSKFILITSAQKSYIIFIIHHLAIDGVSWRLLIDEFIRTYNHYKSGSLNRIREISSYTQWIESLIEYSQSKECEKDKHDLLNQEFCHFNLPQDDKFISKNTLENYNSIWILFSEEQTKLIENQSKMLNTTLPNYILSELAIFLGNIYSTDAVIIDIETHGRETINSDVDISKTIGWFTSVFPIEIKISQVAKEEAIINFLNKVDKDNPKKGLTFGVLRYLEKDKKFKINPRICFNFLGKIDLDFAFKNEWAIENVYSGPCRNPIGIPKYEIILTAKIMNGMTCIEVCFDTTLFDKNIVMTSTKAVAEKILGFNIEQASNAYKVNKVRVIADDKISGGLLSYIPQFHEEKEKTKREVNKKGSVVLLTGASGFVGVHLLKAIIENTDWQVICLMRQNENNAKEYLRNSIAYYYFKEADNIISNEKLSIINGDIGKDALGLDRILYKNLVSNVDLIINAAADVHLFKATPALKSTNCVSIKNLIAFAKEGKKKEIHHLSTLAIAGYIDNSKVSIKFDETDLDIGQKFHNTYEESKFIAEKFLKEYQEEGGNVYVYRLGNITSDSINAIFQKNADTNRIFQMFKSYLLTKCIPDDMEPFSLTPVDIAVQAIMSIANATFIYGGAFNINNTYLFSTDKLLAYFKHAGIELELVSCEEYNRRIMELSLPKETKIVSLHWSKRRRRNIFIKKDKTDLILKKFDITLNTISKKWFSLFLRNNFSKYLNFKNTKHNVV
jgi:thioester reductase-like protein/non-ribosomal peptide synthase protein (TIGR01720 family)